MNSQFKIKFLNQLNKKNNKGFTLIELLVVVIIIGVLAAIALPNLLGQVAKGRQAEAKNGLGTINRAQQAYRLEDAQFTTLQYLPVKIGAPTGTGATYKLTGQYYDFKDGASATADPAASTAQLGSNQRAEAVTTYTNDILDYSSAVAQTTTGVFSAVICEQTTNPNAGLIADAGIGNGTAAASCPNPLKLIK